MSSSSSDDEMLLLLTIIRRRRRRRRINIQREYWVHPYWRQNVESSQYIISKQLLEHPEKFQKLYRMNPDTFIKLRDLLRDHCDINNSRWRDSVGVEERLSIFLRYLSTGLTFTALAYEFYRGVSTVSEIVEHIAECLWETLQTDYMPMPSTNDWTVISDRFYQQWNIPNCLGSIDGKHVRLKCPQNSGSAYYNYHGFFSLVLLACVDADSLFTWISVGDYGRNSDGRVIQYSGFLQALERNDLHIPDPKPLPNTTGPPFPYFYIGDQGFPLKEFLFRPYPKKGDNDVKRAFNYRLSRARKSVECAFGMLAHKFRIFLSQIECEPTKAIKIVKSACVLHNFIKVHDGRIGTPQYENEVEEAYNNLTPLQQTRPIGQSSRAKDLRTMLSDYFTRPENALPFQNMYN